MNIHGRGIVWHVGSSFAYIDIVPVDQRNVTPNPYSIYDPAVVDLFSRMQTPPASDKCTAINNFVVGLKSDGIWAKLDIVYLPNAMGSADYLKCVRGSSYDLVQRASGATYTYKTGFVFNASAYFGSNWLSTVGGFNYALSDASMFIYDESTSGAAMGSDNAYIFNDNNNIYVQANSTDASATSDTPGGFHSWSKSGSTTVDIYKDGTLLASPACNSTALSASEMQIGRANTSAASGTISIAGWGKSLTSTVLYSRAQTYRAAVAALS